ncbi:hypothetical protein ACOSP7_014903 [Xanthoceras sorbifolium]
MRDTTTSCSVAAALIITIVFAAAFTVPSDFLEALPRKLIIGLMTLFLSSTSMMVAFGAAFCIVLSHLWKWAIALICLLDSLPVITLFALILFPLLVDICKSYDSDLLKPKK